MLSKLSLSSGAGSPKTPKRRFSLLTGETMRAMSLSISIPSKFASGSEPRSQRLGKLVRIVGLKRFASPDHTRLQGFT